MANQCTRPVFCWHFKPAGDLIGRTKWRNLIRLSYEGFTIYPAALLATAAIVLWSSPEVGTTVMRPLSFGQRPLWPAFPGEGSAFTLHIRKELVDG